MGKVLFSQVCLFTPAGGGGEESTPSPSHNTSTGPVSFLGDVPVPGRGVSQSQVRVPHWPGQDCGPGQDGVRVDNDILVAMKPMSEFTLLENQ